MRDTVFKQYLAKMGFLRDDYLLSRSYSSTRYAIETLNLRSFADPKYLSNGQNPLT